MKFQVQVTGYGIDHLDYFPGHGLIGTEYDYADYGIGSSFNEALDDSIEMLSQSCDMDLTPEDIQEIESEVLEHFMPETENETWRVELIDSDCYWFVGLRVKRL